MPVPFYSCIESGNLLNQILRMAVWQQAPSAVGSLITLCKFTREFASKKNLENRWRFDTVIAIRFKTGKFLRAM